MTTARRATGQRERNRGRCGETAQTAKTAIIHGGRERKSEKCEITKRTLKCVKIRETGCLMFLFSFFEIIAEVERYRRPELEPYLKQRARKRRKENV